MFQRSGQEIHLPQTLSEEPTGDELSDWEQVSFCPAERFTPGTYARPALFPLVLMKTSCFWRDVLRWMGLVVALRSGFLVADLVTLILGCGFENKAFEMQF